MFQEELDTSSYASCSSGEDSTTAPGVDDNDHDSPESLRWTSGKSLCPDPLELNCQTPQDYYKQGARPKTTQKLSTCTVEQDTNNVCGTNLEETYDYTMASDLEMSPISPISKRLSQSDLQAEMDEHTHENARDSPRSDDDISRTPLPQIPSDKVDEEPEINEVANIMKQSGLEDVERAQRSHPNSPTNITVKAIIHNTTIYKGFENPCGKENELFESNRFPEILAEPFRRLDLEGWQSLASYLGLGKYEESIEIAANSSKKSPSRLLLDKWCKVQGKSADITVIENALKELKYQGCVGRP